MSQPAPEPYAYRRRGPYLAISATTWVDVRHVVVVSETNPPGGPLRVVLDTAEHHVLTSYRPLGEVLDALATAHRDWARERETEQELGRLIALDAEAVPSGEAPPPAAWDVTDRPFG